MLTWICRRGKLTSPPKSEVVGSRKKCFVLHDRINDLVTVVKSHLTSDEMASALVWGSGIAAAAFLVTTTQRFLLVLQPN